MRLKIMFLLFMLSSFLYAEHRVLPVVTDVSWLEKHINDKDIVVIDVRKNEIYRKGHIKGAINMPAIQDFFTPKDLLLPEVSFLRELFSKNGIDNSSKIIIYDNGQFCWSARAFWVFEVLGQKNVSLLKYGYGSYIQSHLPISNIIPKRERKKFIVNINEKMIATKLDVYMAMKKKSPILDGRTLDMYLGKTSVAKRFGHIPTAKLLSASNNYVKTKDGNHLKKFKELQSVYKEIPKDKHTILYCQDGADAALNYIFMHELGYDSAVYEGSWLEWANDFKLPVENPSAKVSKK